MSNINVQGHVGGNVTGDTKKTTKITISIGTLVFIAIIAFIFFSSSSSIEEEIIGTWQNEENTALYMTFSDNNSVMITDNTLGTLNGTYIFTGDNSIKIALDVLFMEYDITADISIDHNTLVFENVNDSYNSGTWLGGSGNTSFKKTK